MLADDHAIMILVILKKFLTTDFLIIQIEIIRKQAEYHLAVSMPIDPLVFDTYH